MRSIKELKRRLASNENQSASSLKQSGDRTFTYGVRNLCLPENIETQSTYSIEGKRGSVRENTCGRRSRGRLVFVDAVILEDAEFGLSLPGWVYNTVGASEASSYFFSADAPFPDLPDMYVVCKGDPYAVGDPVAYDLWEGLGATRM